MSQIQTVTTYQGNLRVVTHLSVLYWVAKMMGLDPTVNLTTNVAQAYLSYIDTRTREAWEMYDWAEFMIDDQRAFAPAWNPTSTYTTGQIVFYWGTSGATGSLTYYQALSSVPANQNPSTATSYWTPNPNVPLPLTVPTYGDPTPTGPTTYFPEIGTVIGVYSNDPLQNQTSVQVPWTRSAKGITIWPQYTTWATSPVVLPGGAITYPYVNLTTVFIYHRQPYPGFAEDEYQSGVSYSVGNVVFYNTDSYQCIQNTTGTQTPSGTTANNSYWNYVPFPYILSDFVKRAAYADALSEDGQQEKAMMILGDAAAGSGAYKHLIREMDKQTIQQGLTQRYTVMIGNTW